MTFLHNLAALLGAVVFALWLLAALGIADFALYFGPAKPKERQVVCQCQSMGHPEQCDEGPGCRWINKLARSAPEASHE